MRKFITRIGCALIGWNPAILNRCGEASVRQFKKLVSAIIIMMILWGCIGYGFAQNYMTIERIRYCCLVALGFMTVVLCIERIIILTVGKNEWMTRTRFALAIVMAILGSSVFDQLMFRNDIDQKVKDNRLITIENIVKNKRKERDASIEETKASIDTLMLVIARNYEQIAKKPTFISKGVDGRQVDSGRRNADGSIIYTTIYDTHQIVVANPLIKENENNEKMLERYRSQLTDYNNGLISLRDEVSKEVNSRPNGFIEELQATLDVITESWISAVFYCIMFLFLFFLETFVVTIKMKDTTCDYDLIVEHELHLKELQLKAIEEKEQEKYVTKQMKDKKPEASKDTTV